MRAAKAQRKLAVDEAVVLDGAAADEALLAGGPGDGGGSGVRLQRPGVGEPCPVVAQLGEYAGAEHGTQAWEAEQDLAVGVLVKGGCGRLREIVRGLAGGVQLLEHGQELVAEGILDAGELVGVLGAEDVPQPLGFRVEAAEAATAFEGAPQAG